MARIPAARSTASHVSPSASPCRSPSARATDHLAALRRPRAVPPRTVAVPRRARRSAGPRACRRCAPPCRAASPPSVPATAYCDGGLGPCGDREPRTGPAISRSTRPRLAFRAGRPDSVTACRTEDGEDETRGHGSLAGDRWLQTRSDPTEPVAALKRPAQTFISRLCNDLGLVSGRSINGAHHPELSYPASDEPAVLEVRPFDLSLLSHS